MNERLYPFEKNRYYYGKLLTTPDFQAEQRYVDYKRMFLNQMILGPGIVCGLGVQSLDESSLLIESGVAIDGMGREIVVPCDVVKKLAALKGYDRHRPGVKCLCLRYKEQDVHPIYVANRKEGQDEYENNRIQEGFEIFLDEQAQCVKEHGLDEEFLVEVTLLENQDYHISIRMPAVACKGWAVRLSVEIRKLTGEDKCLSFQGKLRTPAFITEEGSQELSIIQGDIRLHERETRTYDYWLYAKDAEYDASEILWDAKEAFACIEGERLPFGLANGIPVRLAECTPQELAGWRAGYRPLKERDYNVGAGTIRLADILFGEPEPESQIEAVEEFGVKRYIQVPVTEAIRSWYLSYYSEYADVQETSLRPGGEEKTEIRVAQRPEIASGLLEIPLDARMKKGQICYSEEIIHGLGSGNVYVDAGILNSCSMSGHKRQEKTVVYGDNSLFAGGKGEDTAVRTAVKVFQARGSFQVAAMLAGEQNTISLELQWLAIRIPDKVPEETAQGPMQIVPQASTMRLRPGAKYYVAVDFRNMEPCALQYEVMDPGGGEIGPDGIYIAPERYGIYEIRISCREHRGVVTYVYAVVGGEE